MKILLVDDDRGDAVLVEDALNGEYECVWVDTLAAAEEIVDDSVSCIVLDLGLPDAQGLEGLERMLKARPGAAVVVLTGHIDPTAGDMALAAGAQDYLIKGSTDRETIGRSIRYAIERKRGEETTRRLREADLLRAENARIERGLLPRPLLSSPELRWASRYRPGGRRALLGGDFYDGVELPDGTVRVIVGDVSGHGPDEAALGVALRVAWRALVLAGTEPALVLPKLQLLLDTERPAEHVFATACDVTIAPDRASAAIRLAGHPAPILMHPDRADLIQPAERGPILGLMPTAEWPAHEQPLGDDWGLLMFTDGIIEGRASNGNGRLDDEGLAALVEQHLTDGDWVEVLIDALIAGAEEANGGPLHDDVAVFLLCSGVLCSGPTR